MKKTLFITVIALTTLGLYLVCWPLLEKNLQNILPSNSKPRYSFDTIKHALDGKSYQKYPARLTSRPKQGEYSGEYFNPKTGKVLYLDVSFGGGYKCCEQATYYVIVDRTDRLFWVEEYQASLNEVNDNWFGPFTYTTDPTPTIRKQYPTYEDALIDHDYRKYPTSYYSLPVSSDGVHFFHPVTEQALVINDKTTKKYESQNILSEINGTEFWVRYGTLNVDPEFWYWYGPFEKQH
ncbi:MAG: hypothetical protein WC243_02535 [Patescibacteria group bacterium]